MRLLKLGKNPSPSLSIREKSIWCIDKGVRFEPSQTKSTLRMCLQSFTLTYECFSRNSFAHPMTTITNSHTTSHPVLDGIRMVASSYLLRRLAKALFSIWLVATITFFVIRAMPGSAIDILMQELTAQGVSPDDARNQAAALMNIDLDQPLASQYLEYLGNVLRGDLGNSYRSAGKPVSQLIAQVLP